MKIFFQFIFPFISSGLFSQTFSNGKIKVYFNSPVDTSVSTGENAVQLYYSIDDTLIAYLNRAKYKIDIASYSWNNSGISNISAAVNAAYNRGVKVRVIADSSTNPVGLLSLDPNIKTLLRSFSGGIMHNKFVIIDANSPNPLDSYLWTGSTNLTPQQINSDANNVIIFQDQTFAKAYQIEFEEMWGDTGLVPNKTNSKFGSAKTDNVPHIFNIGGTTVELYFSPSDGTNSKIINAVNSANTDFQFATMLITRNDITSAITSKVSGGVYGLGLVDDSSSTSTWSTLKAGMWQGALVDYSPSAGMMHHKYLIVDQSNVFSDPIVVTGSHNWSTSAETVNDENTVIIHDATIANLYYQEFVKRFETNAGAYGTNDLESKDLYLQVFPNPNKGQFRIHGFRYQIQMVHVYNVFGESVCRMSGSGEKFDFSYLSPGIYFIEVIYESGRKTGKFIRE